MSNNGTDWKTIHGWEGYYEATSCGRVKSLDRVIPDGLGWERLQPGKVLKPWIDCYGYPCVSLWREGKGTKMPVGRAVLLAHHGPPPTPYHQMCHNDGYAREDCRLEAVRWDTSANNRADQFGIRHLTDADIEELRRKREAGASTIVLGEEYERSQHAVSNICTGKRYRHVGGPLTTGSNHPNAAGPHGPLRTIERERR